MPRLKMTDAAVRTTIAEPGQRIDHFDAHPRDRQRGLVLRVSASRDALGAIKIRLTGWFSAGFEAARGSGDFAPKVLAGRTGWDGYSVNEFCAAMRSES